MMITIMIIICFIWITSKVIQIAKRGDQDPQSNCPRDKVIQVPCVDLDKHLNLHQHFDNVYKKASAKVKLLSRIREKVSPYVAESICKSMIRPLLLYCYTLQLSLPQGTVNKLQYIQNRAAKIVNPKA